MKAMKGNMNKMLGSMKRKTISGPPAPQGPVSTNATAEQGEPPEATAARCVRAFCELGNPQSSGDEVLYLPTIVDSAESSPPAAAECARQIRKYLARDYFAKPSYQYNAIMLIRILTDNPGPTFTRNLDKKFVETCKELLRTGKDLSVRQMMMETLDAFENTKGHDEGLGLLIEMWRREKEKAYRTYGGRPPPPPGPRTLNAPPFDPNAQNYFRREHRTKRLPDAVELANRLEEARTSAKLLCQVVACTPPAEVLSNDLIKEFADRCQSASRSIQGYMVADDPAPDNDTMESLIDTNEQLQSALNQHQRAVLGARKHLGIGDADSPIGPPVNGSSRPSLVSDSQYSPTGSSRNLPSLPIRGSNGKGKGTETGQLLIPFDDQPGGSSGRASSSSRHGGAVDESDNPFRDPPPQPIANRASGAGSGTAAGRTSYETEEPRLAIEPFHPGFRATPSHLDRQESALNNLTMHGGATSSSPGGAGGSSSGRRAAADDDDEELYEASPKRKEPMYRY